METSKNDLIVEIKKQAKDLEATKEDLNSKLDHLNSKVDRLEAQFEAKYVELMAVI